MPGDALSSGADSRVTIIRQERCLGQEVLGFGHEMNGAWYSWGYRQAPPKVFVAAWRRIVRVFRAHGATNVTWLWTINVLIHTPKRFPNPGAWWPGRSYVTWVGIDGYFRTPSVQFAPLFGPTIIKVRELTQDPLLISETGAPPPAGQSAKIAELSAGVREYRLLGFILDQCRRLPRLPHHQCGLDRCDSGCCQGLWRAPSMNSPIVFAAWLPHYLSGAPAAWA